MAASLRVAVVLLLACCALVHQASAVNVDRSRSKARAEVDAEAVAALEREQAEFRALLEDAQPAPASQPAPTQTQAPAGTTVVPVSATGKPPAAAAPAQPAAAQNRTRRIDLTTGYGMYTGLLMRVKNNANAEKRAVFLTNTTQQTECNTTLSRINTTLQTRRNQVETARNTIIAEERKIFTAEWELNTTILPLLNFKRRQLYSVNGTIADGEVRRALEARIFANKTADAQTVLNAVRAVVMLLHSMRNGGATSPNGTNVTVAAAQARFREKMEEASSQIRDPELMRFVEATMQTFQAVGNTSAASNATAANSTLPSKETDGMRLLLQLLRTQISQYMAQLARADSANNETWSQTRLQLRAQLSILTEEVSKLDADRLAEERKITTAAEIRNNQVTLINSNLLNEIALLEKEQETFLVDCNFKLGAMNNQTQSLDDMLGTLSALEKLDFTRQDEGVLKRIMESVKLPPADRVDNTGKRCCVVCRRGRKACGDRCVLAEEACRAPAGCACDLASMRRP